MISVYVNKLLIYTGYIVSALMFVFLTVGIAGIADLFTYKSEKRRTIAWVISVVTCFTVFILGSIYDLPYLNLWRLASVFWEEVPEKGTKSGLTPLITLGALGCIIYAIPVGFKALRQDRKDGESMFRIVLAPFKFVAIIFFLWTLVIWMLFTDLPQERPYW